LKYLCLFLHRVTDFASDNLMSSENLAIVFAPNLIRPQQETPQSLLTELTFVIGVCVLVAVAVAVVLLFSLC
jgi:hypothetical protein